jgi:hypothetical protein
MTLKSITGAAYIDKTDAMEDKCTQSYVTFILENPKADLTKLEAAIKQCIANNTENESQVILVREKEWLVFSRKEPKEKDSFTAICQVPEGYLLTIQPSMERAETVRTGAVKPIAAGNPLMMAFAPKGEGVDGCCTYMIKDLSELLNRYMDADDLAQLKVSYPPAPQTQAIILSTATRGTTTEFKIAINTETEAAAQQTMEAFLGYKMLAQMMGPSMLGNPNSKLVAFIAGISCKVEGKTVIISCSITPEVILPIVAEFQEMQKQAAATFSSFADDEDDFDLDLDEDEDEEPLSPEEAKAILDALDVE